VFWRLSLTLALSLRERARVREMGLVELYPEERGDSLSSIPAPSAAWQM
jgi:hypothetical protein